MDHEYLKERDAEAWKAGYDWCLMSNITFLLRGMEDRLAAYMRENEYLRRALRGNSHENTSS